MKLGGVQRTRRRTFVQLPLTFLCELCGLAREKVLASPPGRLGLGRCGFCFSPRRKARKGKSKAKRSADPGALRAARGFRREVAQCSVFPNSVRKGAARRPPVLPPREHVALVPPHFIEPSR